MRMEERVGYHKVGDRRAEEILSRVIIHDGPLDRRPTSTARGRKPPSKPTMWLEHPLMVEPKGTPPSALEVNRVRGYPARHQQISGTGLHLLSFHKPRNKLSRLQEYDYHECASRLEGYITARDVPVTAPPWDNVGENVVSRFSELFGSGMARSAGKIKLDFFVPDWEPLLHTQVVAYRAVDFQGVKVEIQRWLKMLEPRWRPEGVGDARAIVARSPCTDTECQRPVVFQELERFVRHAAALHITQQDLQPAEELLETWLRYAEARDVEVECPRFWDVYFWLKAELYASTHHTWNPPAWTHLSEQHRELLEQRKIHTANDLSEWSRKNRTAVQEAPLAFQCFRMKYATEGPLAVIDHGGNPLEQANMIIEKILNPPEDLGTFCRILRNNRSNRRLGQDLRTLTQNNPDPSVIFRALRVSFELDNEARREVHFVLCHSTEDDMRTILKGYRDRKVRPQQVIDRLSNPGQVRSWMTELDRGMESSHAIGL